MTLSLPLARHLRALSRQLCRRPRTLCALLTLWLAPGAAAWATDASPAPCAQAGTLVIDAYSADPPATRAALDALATGAGVRALFSAAPARVLEGALPQDHFVAAYKFDCAQAALDAMRGPAWERLMGSLRAAPAQRLTVFAPAQGHNEPSPATAACQQPAYFVLKGRVTDVPGYFVYLRALSASGLLARHGYRREVVMDQSERRLARSGPSFEPGEFFEILRFPCRAEAERFWFSAEYRELVTLREGRMTADVLLYN